MKFWKIVFAVLLLFCMPIALAEAANANAVRIGVLPFTSKASGMSNHDASIIADIFTRNLTSSKSVMLLEREQLAAIARENRLTIDGIIDPNTAIQLGKIAGCQYMLAGSVTELSIQREGFGNLFGQTIAKATVDMRVFSVTTGHIGLSLSESGTSSESSYVIPIGGGIWRDEAGGLYARALDAATEKLANRLRGVLLGEFSQVISVGGKTVTVNRGATSGVKKDSLYLIYCDGKEMFDIDLTSLGHDKLNVAVIKISSVNDAFSTGNVVDEGGNASLIRRGDKIEPVTSQEAKKLSFIDRRPRDPVVFDDPILPTSEPSLLTPTPTPRPLQPVTPDPRTTPAPPVRPSQADTSTDPNVVVPTYFIDPGEVNLRRLAHINAGRQRGNRAIYEAYVELANSYEGDYLAAYNAGRLARDLKMNDDAKMWLDMALAVNPNYKPALDLRARIK